jgi:hypothetical protein
MTESAAAKRSVMGLLSALRARRRGDRPQPCPNQRLHHTAAPLARLAALGAILALAACSESSPIHPFDSAGQTNWTEEFQRINQPGLLGAFIDRRPPAVTIRASGPYPGPLSDTAPPLLTQAMAEAIVAAPLRAGLSPAALMDLARASVLAASLATGTSVAWKAADANGTVTPARDVYLSRHGRACRDLRQALDKAGSDKSGSPEIAAVTLCRPHVGDDRAVWEAEDPD